MSHRPVSLLLPNRDNEAVLDLTLERLAEHTTHPNVEVVAVDDGSRDGSVEILRRWRDSGRFPSFVLLEREHGGVVEALNACLDAASGEVVVQLDSDATVESPGWLERMVALLEADERVGVVTGKVVFDHGEIQACGVNLVGPEGFHDRPSEITEHPGRRRWHHRVRRFEEGTREEERAVAEVDSGIGCCMAYRRADALSVGGYDTGFSPLWFDDLDLCMAIRRMGKKVFFTPEARVVHRFGMRRRRASEASGLAGRARERAWRMAAGVGRVLAPATRTAVMRRVGLDRPRPEHRDRLRHHYAYWERKWGWHPLNPDMAALVRRHGGSEVCWALEPELAAAGREIAERYESAGVSTG